MKAINENPATAAPGAAQSNYQPSIAQRMMNRKTMVSHSS